MNDKRPIQLRMLYVDGNPEERRVLQQCLSQYGFEVVTSANRADATFQVNSDSGFECVLTEHRLPDGTGSELSASLRSNGYKGQIIVLSDLLTLRELGPYKKSSISGFLQKPLKFEMLAVVLLKAWWRPRG
jgi:DNA-binding NtrC family response regulator